MQTFEKEIAETIIKRKSNTANKENTHVLKAKAENVIRSQISILSIYNGIRLKITIKTFYC